MAHFTYREYMESVGPIHPNDCGHRSDEYIGSIEVFEISDDGTWHGTPVDVYVHGNDRHCLCIRHGSQGDYIGTTFRGIVGYEPKCPLTKQTLRYLAQRGHFAFKPGNGSVLTC